MKYWTSEEDIVIKKFYPRSEKSLLEEKLPGRTWEAIQGRAKRLKIGREIRPKSTWIEPQPEPQREKKIPLTCDSVNCEERRFAGKSSSGGDIFYCPKYDGTVGRFAKPTCIKEK